MDGYSKNTRMDTLIAVVLAFLQDGYNPEYYVEAFHLLRTATSHLDNGFTSNP